MTEYRNPFTEHDRRMRQTIMRSQGKVAYARACTASKDYVIVNVPLKDGKEDRRLLEPHENRFLDHNVTPREYEAQCQHIS